MHPDTPAPPDEAPTPAPAPAQATPHGAHLRGAARLATDATAGLVGLVEAMHARIASPPGLPVRAGERTTGITGLVYRSIHGVTKLVGGSVDALLRLVEPQLLRPGAPSAEREALLAALNGVLGDHLAASSNPLATPMTLRVQGQDVSAPGALAAAGPALLLQVHGLCMHDRQWLRKGHDHGAVLARTLGFTPVALRYNSGRAIADNGRDLALQLEDLLQRWPVPLQRFAAIGHSMGGLVLRSALHQAAQQGLRWPARLQDLVFLGTPHRGAPLERAGHGVDLLLGATPYAAPLARLGRVRSAGITDLRHGLPADAVPLPPGLRCWAVAATLGAPDAPLKTRLLGDGLVPLDSALGRHRDPQRSLGIPAERQCVVPSLGHLDLLSSDIVAETLQRWLAAPTEPAAPGSSE